MTSRPLGPARENDVSVELRGLEPVPGAERYGRPFRIFTMWLSPQFTPSALFIGVLAASLGLSFWQGLPAIVIGLFFLMLVIAGSDGYAWAPYAADYSRYFPASVSRRKIFWYTFAAVAGGLTWMMLLGLSVAHRVADAGTIGTASAIRDLMGGGALGVLAMIAIYLATVAADIVNDYTGSLSLQAAGITVRRPAIALINGAAAFGFSAWFLCAPGALYDKVENLLLFFTYWISAWLGVVVVDWVRRRGRVCVAELRDFGKLQWSAPALIAFVAGFAASIPFSNTTAGYDFVASHPAFKDVVGYFAFGPLHQADLGFIVAFAVAAVLYRALQRRPATPIPETPR
jgi:nucleobase:cation symporter-1, NCS1 family